MDLLDKGAAGVKAFRRLLGALREKELLGPDDVYGFLRQHDVLTQAVRSGDNHLLEEVTALLAQVEKPSQRADLLAQPLVILRQAIHDCRDGDVFASYAKLILSVQRSVSKLKAEQAKGLLQQMLGIQGNKGLFGISNHMGYNEVMKDGERKKLYDRAKAELEKSAKERLEK